MSDYKMEIKSPNAIIPNEQTGNFENKYMVEKNTDSPKTITINKPPGYDQEKYKFTYINPPDVWRASVVYDTANSTESEVILNLENTPLKNWGEKKINFILMEIEEGATVSKKKIGEVSIEPKPKTEIEAKAAAASPEGTQQNQEQPNPAVPSTPAETDQESVAKDTIIEGEVAKLLKDFEELQKDFDKEKTGIEESIGAPIVIVKKAQEGEPAQQSQSQVPAAVLTNGSKIILLKQEGREGYEIQNFKYASSEELIDAIGYTEGTFKNFSEVKGDFKINFETDLDGKSVKIDMGEINSNDTEAYILGQIDAAFKSGTESAPGEGGGKKRKNKTKGNKSPIKKKRRTKRK